MCSSLLFDFSPRPLSPFLDSLFSLLLLSSLSAFLLPCLLFSFPFPFNQTLGYQHKNNPLLSPFLFSPSFSFLVLKRVLHPTFRLSLSSFL